MACSEQENGASSYGTPFFRESQYGCHPRLSPFHRVVVQWVSAGGAFSRRTIRRLCEDVLPHRLSTVSRISRWADSRSPGSRTAEIRVGGQRISGWGFRRGGSPPCRRGLLRGGGSPVGDDEVGVVQEPVDGGGGEGLGHDGVEAGRGGCWRSRRRSGVRRRRR